MCWFLHPQGYAFAENPKKNGKRWVLMHRLVMDTPDGKDTDHKNRDKLDNRKKNLRICTRSQNIARVTAWKKNALGYRGIQKSRWNGYEAKIKIMGKTKYLGTFPTTHEAAKAYNRAAKKYFGKYATLNIL